MNSFTFLQITIQHEYLHTLKKQCADMLGPVFLDIGFPLFGFWGAQKNLFNFTKLCPSYLTQQLLVMIG